MSGTNAVNAKRAVVALLQSLPDFQGVSVTYGWPGPEPPREYAYCGRSTSGMQPMTFQASGQRLPTDETLTFGLILIVAVPGGDVETAEARVVELGAAFEQAIGVNPKMTGLSYAPPGVLLVQVVSAELDQDFDDEQAYARLVYQVRFRSELT